MKPKTITNEQLISFIEQHLEDELSIKYIADYFGYSEFHFSRVFKSQMGTSLMEYACKRRMIKATEEITRRHNIIDVAIKYGWKNKCVIRCTCRRIAKRCTENSRGNFEI